MTHTHPLAKARSRQEASKPKAQLSELIYQGIIDRLKIGPVHADDLEPIFPVGERDTCRRLVGGQFGSLVQRRYIYETERRKSQVPSRHGAKSGVYEFTRLGRETLVGVSAGVPSPQGTEGSTSSPLCASADPGGNPSGAPSGAMTGEEVAPVSGPAAPEPARLFEFEEPGDEEKRRPVPSAYDPWSKAA